MDYPEWLAASDPEGRSRALVFTGTAVPLQHLFDYLTAERPLAEFLASYPEVAREQAVALLELVGSAYDRSALTAHITYPPELVWVDPGRMSGTPCFRDSRVPVQDVFDYIDAGDSLDLFLDEFPTVTRERAVGVLRVAGRLGGDHAHPA